MKWPACCSGIDLLKNVDYFRASFPLRSDLTLDLVLIACVSSCLSHRTRDLYGSSGSGTFEGSNGPHRSVISDVVQFLCIVSSVLSRHRDLFTAFHPFGLQLRSSLFY